MSKPMQTLLTGFGPFGNVADNPSGRLAEYFAGEEVAGHELTVSVLPTSYARAPQKMRALLEIGGRGGKPFDNILMLGVASGSLSWRVERVGRNWNETKPDVDGYTPTAGVILPGLPETLPVTFPVEEIVLRLEQAELPVIASDSAGAYLCNCLLYTTLSRLQTSPLPVRAGFLHIPADEQTYAPGLTSGSFFPFERHIEAVRVALRVLTETDLAT